MGLTIGVLVNKLVFEQMARKKSVFDNILFGGICNGIGW